MGSLAKMKEQAAIAKAAYERSQQRIAQDRQQRSEGLNASVSSRMPGKPS